MEYAGAVKPGSRAARRRACAMGTGRPSAQPSGIAVLGRSQEIRLVLLPIRLAHGRAVEGERAAHEETVADVPGVLALLAPHGLAARAAQIDLLALLEDVLLQLLPV